MRPRNLGWLAVTAMLVVPTAACTRDHKQPPAQPSVAYEAAATPRPVGQGTAQVFVQGAQVPTTIQSVVDPQAQLKLGGAVGVGPILAITPAGKLPAKVTLSFPLAQPTKPTDGLLIASAESAAGPWTLEQTTVAPDGRSLLVATDHFSLWSRVKLDVTGAVGEFKKAFIDNLTGDFTTEADKPRCQNENKARTDGYSITSSAKDTLYWCFGVEGGQRVLKLVNRRRYPLQVDHPGFKVKSAGRIKADLDQLARLGSGSQTIAFPYEEIVLTPTMSAGSSGKVSTEFSGWAQSLYQLETGLSTAASILTRFGAGEGVISNGAITKSKFDQIAKIMDKVLGGKDCFEAVRDVDPVKVITKCLNPSEIIEIFGWKGVILAPVMVAGSLLSYFRSEFNSLGDQLNGRDKYTVTVKRAIDPRFKPFIGEWGGHGTALSLYKDQTGLWSYRNYGCEAEQSGSQCFNFHRLQITVHNGYLTAKVTSEYYRVGGRKAPSSYNPGPSLVGKQFKITPNPDHSDMVDWVEGSNEPYSYCKQGGPSGIEGLCGA